MNLRQRPQEVIYNKEKGWLQDSYTNFSSWNC